MKKMVQVWRSALLIFLIASLALLQGCSGRCSLPCWHGITPGKTSIEEALSIVRALPGVHHDDIKVIKSPSGDIKEIIFNRWGIPQDWWYLPVKYTSLHNEITAEKGVVTFILLHLTITDTLTLGEVVERYGPPEYYGASYYNAWYSHDPDTWEVVLFYLQLGMAMSVKAPPERRGYITPDLEITYLMLHIPMTIEEFSRIYKIVPYLYLYLKPWEGFHYERDYPCFPLNIPWACEEVPASPLSVPTFLPTSTPAPSVPTLVPSTPTPRRFWPALPMRSRLP